MRSLKRNWSLTAKTPLRREQQRNDEGGPTGVTAGHYTHTHDSACKNEVPPSLVTARVQLVEACGTPTTGFDSDNTGNATLCTGRRSLGDGLPPSLCLFCNTFSITHSLVYRLAHRLANRLAHRLAHFANFLSQSELSC